MALSSENEREIRRRRTFAIISHPDAGKTTMTEKLLLLGGAIQMAGTVKAKRSKRFATSDWMEIEKRRGISVTSSVMKFPYRNHEINLIDTPGHQDFSEDTYRTLTAVDSALMLIDAANGVETQTKKLFHVCRLRATPILAFINKMDRDGREPFDLLDEIEKVLGIACCPMTWPIGQGPFFQGVYDRQRSMIVLHEKGTERVREVQVPPDRLAGEEVSAVIGPEAAATLASEIELLEGAGGKFLIEDFLQGRVAPTFFGSALYNFGVQAMLDALVDHAPGPLPRAAKSRIVGPMEDKFSAFVFKIQANMDPAHRDRVAFIRVCSGRFERGMKAFHVRLGRLQRLGRPTQFLAQDRSLIDEAFAGDIVGIHDPGVFKIGDTVSEGESLVFTGIPTFAPEHFVRVVLKDPLKSKQLERGLDQLSEEGAVQVFRPIYGNDQYLGVVGQLQFDVVKFRIENEYNVAVNFVPLPYTAARWIAADQEVDLENFKKDQASNLCTDQHENLTVLLDHEWRLKVLNERHPRMHYYTTSEALVGLG